MEEKKFCKFCGEQIDKNSVICPKCGRQLETVKEETTSQSIATPGQTTQEPKTKGKMSKKTKIIIAIVVSLVVLGLIFGGSSDETENNNQSNENTTTNENTQGTSKTNYSFNDTFEFDDLEITIGSSYTFTTINNEYSDYYKKDIVKLPIIVKNLKDETHSLNMFYYNIFGSLGTEVESTWVYFDDSLENAGELRSGASYTKYLYFIYDGDGTYTIEFNDIWDEKTVEFEIKK